MNTLQQLAWTTYVRHYRYTHANSPSIADRNLLLALQYCYGEALTCRIERGDRLPGSTWSTYQ